MADPTAELLAHVVHELAEVKAMLSAMQSGVQQPTEQWMSTTKALKAEAFKAQSIRHREALLQLVRIGVLPVDGIHVRNVSDGSQRPTYEFHIETCTPLIEQYKRLSPQTRQEIYGKAA